MKNSILFYSMIFYSILSPIYSGGQEVEPLENKFQILNNKTFDHQGQRRDLYLEEIKVRWKKAALENCPVVSCASCGAGSASSTPTVTQNTAMTNITHTTTIATGIGTATGLPSGVSANWSSNTITISGTPTATGTFIYSIPLIGTGCGSVNATGTITVNVTAFICGTNSVLDIDNNTYNTVLIGAQCWTKENLRVTKYNDGTNIPEITSTGTWNTTIVTGARTVYNDLPANLTTYGYLYNWYAVADARKICPDGWHVPSDGEWTSLILFLDPTANIAAINASQSSIAGGKMKSAGTTIWNNPNVGADNSSGFSALPGGVRHACCGGFWNIRDVAFFWSATDAGGIDAYLRELHVNQNNVVRTNYNDINGLKSAGFSIRCLKN
jgi:uncharacterized protein (TIGR02145 family)